MESATKVRQDTCPWQALRDPFTQAVMAAHRWYLSNQLSTRYPRLPEALARGIEVYDSALNLVRSHDLKAERDKSQAEAKRRQQKSALQQGGVRTWR